MVRVMKTFRLTRSAAIIVAILCAGALASAPAHAQIEQSSLTLNGVTFALSPEELDRLTALGHVVHTTDRGSQDRALDLARSIANSADARYILALYQFEIGRQRRDDALSAPALDVLIASRLTPHERLASYLGVRGGIAFHAGDYATASALWTRLRALQPNDPEALNNLAQVRAALNDSQGAIDLLRSAIAARRAGPAQEIWYRQWLAIANAARLVDQGVAAAHALVAAYPTPTNWRDSLVAYRQLAAPQGGAEIDLLRLMRTVGALARPAEYQRLAQLLLHAGFAAEARAVLDEGISRGVVNRTESPTPAISAEIDRALAPQRARVASAVVPANRGVAPEGAVQFAQAVADYRAGHRPEAEAAFRALAGHAEGQGAARWYPDLAAFWLAWLAHAG
jgi:tetratricopeptide (TPR) repeat protein